MLAGIRGVTTAEVVEQFSRLGLPQTIRAQELSGEQWKQLYQAGI